MHPTQGNYIINSKNLEKISYKYVNSKVIETTYMNFELEPKHQSSLLTSVEAVRALTSTGICLTSLIQTNIQWRKRNH